jgi:hypothetical protein
VDEFGVKNENKTNVVDRIKMSSSTKVLFEEKKIKKGDE